MVKLLLRFGNPPYTGTDGGMLIQAIIGPSMMNATAYTPMAMSTAMVSTTATAMSIPRNVLLLILRDYPSHVEVTHP